MFHIPGRYCDKNVEIVQYILHTYLLRVTKLNGTIFVKKIKLNLWLTAPKGDTPVN